MKEKFENFKKYVSEHKKQVIIIGASVATVVVSAVIVKKAVNKANTELIETAIDKTVE